MSNEPPRCFECRSGGPRRCAPDGVFDLSYLAQMHLEYIDSIDSAGVENELFWTWECMREQVQSAPEIAFEIVLLMIDAIPTSREASHIAAGPLEEIIAEHGPQFIDRIEVLARRSPRIRFVLTGVWPLGNKNTPEWMRVEAIKKTGPHIDRDDLPPATGLT